MFSLTKRTIVASLLLAPLASPAARTDQQARADRVEVFPDEPGFTADISPNGQHAAVFTQPYGSGTAANPARIEIRNLRTGERVTLAGGESSAGTPGGPAAVFSPDSRMLAYNWLDTRLTGTGMLQVIGVDAGARPRTVIPADPSDIGIIPQGWSPDGQRIFVFTHGPSVSLLQDPISFAWVSVADGSMRTIKTLEPWRDGISASPRVSPDGRWIVYSAVARQGSTDRRLHLVDAENGTERRIATVPGSSSVPFWSPDGSHVIFVNKPSPAGTTELLALDITAPDEAPRGLQRPFTGIPFALPATGILYWMEPNFGWTAVVTDLGESRRVIDQFSGYGLTWLGNDKLAFVRDDANVTVRVLNSGEERNYFHGALSTNGPRVLGSDLLLHIPPHGDGGRPGGGYYRLDLTRGAFTRLFSRDEAGQQRSSVSAVSPDNRTVYLGLLTPERSRWSSIVAVDLQSGVPRHVTAVPDSVPPVQGLAVSPDGKTLAVHANDGRVFTAAVDGGTLRQITDPLAGGGWSEVMRWSPDGQYIVYGTREDATSTNWRLMRVRPQGGAPEFVGVDSSRLSKPGRLISIALSPDAKRVALTVRTERTFDVRAFRELNAFLQTR